MRPHNLLFGAAPRFELAVENKRYAVRIAVAVAVGNQIRGDIRKGNNFTYEHLFTEKIIHVFFTEAAFCVVAVLIKNTVFSVIALALRNVNGF